MPRTKVSKSSKRNRETTNREEKVREFENSLEGFQNTLDDKMQAYLTAFEDEMKMLLQRTPRALLKLKMTDILSLVSVNFRVLLVYLILKECFNVFFCINKIFIYRI